MSESTEIANVENPKVPAYLKKEEGSTGLASDLATGVWQTYNSISIKGSKFHISRGGVKTTLADENGHALPEIKLIIVGGNDKKSKLFYSAEDDYEGDTTKKPVCFSNDGITPHGGTEIQAPRCDLCKWNEPGSKITKRSNRARACSDRKRIAVCGTQDFSEIYLLNLPVMSHQSLALLAQKIDSWGSAMEGCIVSVSFVLEAEFPQLQFEFYDFLKEEAYEKVKKSIADNAKLIEAILNPIGSGAQHIDDLAEGDSLSAQAVRAKQAAKEEGKKYPGMSNGDSSDVDPPQKAEEAQGSANAQSDDVGAAIDDDIPESAKRTPKSEAQAENERAADPDAPDEGWSAEGEGQAATKEPDNAPGSEDVDKAAPGLGSANFM